MDAAAEPLNPGKQRWDTERPLRLAGGALIGQLGDIAAKLRPDQLVSASDCRLIAERAGSFAVDEMRRARQPVAGRPAALTSSR